MKILVIHGPNLNMLGQRDANHYGSFSYEELCLELERFAITNDFVLDNFQSNHEGNIIDHLQNHACNYTGLVINPGGLTHTSVVLRDALLSVSIPFIEVHISNIYKRESFRHQSFLRDIAVGSITGLGKHSYILALEYFKRHFINS